MGTLTQAIGLFAMGVSVLIGLLYALLTLFGPEPEIDHMRMMIIGPVFLSGMMIYLLGIIAKGINKEKESGE